MRRIVFAAVVMAGIVWPSVAGATLPGRNGAIVVQIEQCDAGCDVWLIARDQNGGPSSLVEQYLSWGLTDPALAPGGHTLSAGGGGPRLLLLPVPGSQRSRPREIRTRSSASARAPSWAPDGKQLVFMLQPSQDKAVLYRAARSGNPLGRLGPTYKGRFFSPLLAPDWSARGEIVFSEPGPPPQDRFSQSLSIGLHTIRPDGSGLRPVTSGADYEPNWSPSGKTVAFVRATEDRMCGEIQLVRRDGTGLRPLTTGACDSDPAWSPDGKRVAFVRDHDSLYRINADGSGLRRLFRTDSDASLSNPAWQPLPR